MLGADGLSIYLFTGRTARYLSTSRHQLFHVVGRGISMAEDPRPRLRWHIPADRARGHPKPGSTAALDWCNVIRRNLFYRDKPGRMRMVVLHLPHRDKFGTSLYCCP